MKKNIWATLVAILIALPLIISSVLSDDIKSDKKDPVGKKIFLERKCNTCHSINSQDIKLAKAKAPDLSAIGLTQKADFIKDFITKKVKMNDKNHMIAFKGTDDELKDLVAWLMTLKTAPEIDKK